MLNTCKQRHCEQGDHRLSRMLPSDVPGLHSGSLVPEPPVPTGEKTQLAKEPSGLLSEKSNLVENFPI